MPPGPAINPRRRKPVHWWNEEVAEQRRKCLSAKRMYQRAARRHEVVRLELLQAAYRTEKKALTLLIRSVQENCWKDLCNVVKTDPWGLPYKVVTKKIGSHPSGSESKGRELEIAEHLFPTLPLFDWN